MPRSRKAPPPIDLERVVADVAAAVRRDGGVLRSRLAKLGVPKAAQAEAVARLVAAGLEATPKAVRVPLLEQLAARLEGGAMLPLRGIAHAVTGATAAEATKAATELARAGRATLVLRGKELALTAARPEVLDDAKLALLERTAAELAKTLKVARKHRAVLLAADVRDALAPFVAAAPARVAVADVLAEARTQTAAGGLVFVPALVRALGGPSARDAVHDALRDAAKRGLLELRPESGLARLSDEDLALCLPGPRGSCLSWARPIGEAP